MCREETLDELSSGLDEDDDEESEEALTARNVFEGAHNGTTIHSSIPKNDDKDEKVGYRESSWITSPQGARGCAAATSSPGSSVGQPEVSAFQQRSSPIL